VPPSAPWTKYSDCRAKIPVSPDSIFSARVGKWVPTELVSHFIYGEPEAPFRLSVFCRRQHHRVTGGSVSGRSPLPPGVRLAAADASHRIPPAEKYGCAGTVLKRRRVERGQTIPAVSPRRPGTSRVLAVPGSTSWDACRGALISPGTSCIENSAAYPAVLPIQPFHETPVRSSPPAQTICGRLAGRHDQCAYRQRRGRASCPGTIRLHDADWVK